MSDGDEESKKYDLRLYVAGQTPRSLAALVNLKRICEERLKGQYRIEVIDLKEHPELARSDEIMAIPTVGKKASGADKEDHRGPIERGKSACRPRYRTT